MRTRKSGLLALVLGLAVFGAACEEKDDVVTPPTPPTPVTLNIAPDPVPALTVGQTVQLVAIVSGSATQTATWSSSNTTVATVDAASGLVTARAVGVAVITAVSTVDATARDAVTIQVTAGTPPVQPGTPSISIQSVTQGGTLFPVNPGNVQGTIDIVMNVDVPQGVTATAVVVTLDGNEVCRQNFTGSTAGQDAAQSQVPVTIVCSINTAEFNAQGVARFLNGTHTLRAQVLNNTTPIATATFQPLIFNNQNFVRATSSCERTAIGGTNPGPGGLAPAGSQWCGGTITFQLLPVIYTAAGDRPATYTVSLTTGGTGSNGTGACTGVAAPGALPNCGAATVTQTATGATTGATTVTFAGGGTATAATNDVAAIEDVIANITVNSVTVGGQAGPACINTDPSGNPVSGCAGGNVALFQNPLRVDNLAPRVVNFAITPNQYLNGSFLFAADADAAGAACNPALVPPNANTLAPCYGTVDYGVDSQTTVFNVQTTAGTTVARGANVTNPGGVDETATATELVVQAVVTDALQNSRSVFATAPGTAPSTTLAGAARFGVDITAPTMATTGFADNSTAPAAGGGVANTNNNTITFNASDAATPPAGPSGVRGINVKVERFTPAGTVCLNPSLTPAAPFAAGQAVIFAGQQNPTNLTAAQATTANACGTGSEILMGNPATVVLPDVAAYYRVSGTPVDIAGNVGATTRRVQLRDFTAPTVGGIVSPSSISGNTDVTFTTFTQDNVEVGDLLAAVDYGALVELEQSRTGYGTYGFDLFNNTVGASFVVPQFIRSIETTAGNVPTGAAQLASEINAYVRDVAGVQLANNCAGLVNASNQNCTNRQDGITPSVQLGIGAAAEPTTFGMAGRPFGAGTNNGGTFFGQTHNATPFAGAGAGTSGGPPAANTNVCSDNPQGAAAGCAVVTARSVTLTAQAQGPAQTFANPFQRVVFYAIDPTTGRAFQVCTAAVSVTDNTTNNTRTWVYQCTWTPTQAAGVYQTFALGVDASGRALMSGNRQITVTSD